MAAALMGLPQKIPMEVIAASHSLNHNLSLNQSLSLNHSLNHLPHSHSLNPRLVQLPTPVLRVILPLLSLVLRVILLSFQEVIYLLVMKTCIFLNRK